MLSSDTTLLHRNLGCTLVIAVLNLVSVGINYFANCSILYAPLATKPKTMVSISKSGMLEPLKYNAIAATITPILAMMSLDVNMELA
jgi:hypothetical protein